MDKKTESPYYSYKHIFTHIFIHTVLVRILQRNRTGHVHVFNVIYFKELALIVVGVGKLDICRVGWQVEDSWKS